MKLILTHDHADFDALASLLGAARLNADHLPLLPDQLNANVSRFLALYGGGLPFINRAQLSAKRIEQVIAVDTQRVAHRKGMTKKTLVHFIDHHPMTAGLTANQSFSGAVTGACATLLVEQIEAQGLALNPLEATLLTLGIYEDTGSLAYGTTTARDLRAAAWLLDQGAALDTIRQFLAHPLDEAQQTLLTQLLQAAVTRTLQGHRVTVAAVQAGQPVNEISTVAQRLRDLLDTQVLLVLVQLPATLHLVARATVDSVELGDVARFYGGGGHRRAAAATLKEHTFEAAAATLWEQVEQHITPLTTVRDLMSYGAYAVEHDRPLHEIAPRLRRIGHEGYPVVEHGRLVGLLTRRDLDRALEHGLGQMQVREVMQAGAVSVQSGESFDHLQRLMTESERGQVPVVDENGRVIGIVTRTDVLAHWRRLHSGAVPAGSRLDPDRMQTVLGFDAALSIQRIAEAAQTSGEALYLVGGCVRDLLLGRRNLDLDFVVEGDAIALARRIAAVYGGEVSAYPPFGTATWKLTAGAAEKLGVQAALPDHIDFVTARNEYYESPTALPTVYSGSIKLDLARRDFTINTLAVQLSPQAAAGRLLDPFQGVKDLNEWRIRVLHNLSLVDDPTRILRAYRFQHRLGFQIEARTASLIDTALPMLGRITGQRLSNEITLLLKEDHPETVLQALHERGILAAIHPAFILPTDLAACFEAARTVTLPWEDAHFTLLDRYWFMLVCHLPPESITALTERLLIPQSDSQRWLAARRLLEDVDWLADPAHRPSAIADYLNDLPDAALLAGWLLLESPLIRERIARYALEWRAVKPALDGEALKRMGLKPGPCFSLILRRLRAGILDGELHTAADERASVTKWIAAGLCDEPQA